MNTKTIKTMKYSIIGMVLLLSVIFLNVQITFAIEESTMWSLLNLILVVGNLLLSGVLLINYIRSKKSGENDCMSDYALVKLFSLFIAVFAAGIFTVTQNMTLPMAIVDEWTGLMVVIALIQGSIGIFTIITSTKGREDKKTNYANI